MAPLTPMPRHPPAAVITTGCLSLSSRPCCRAVTEADFTACAAFDGARKGQSYKNGKFGVG